MKKIFLICFSMLACVFDVNAALNCTQDVPAGKYCKNAGNKPDCPEGCYCTGSRQAIGSINVAFFCSQGSTMSAGNNSTNILAKMNASGIYFCPDFTTSHTGAKTVNDCYHPQTGEETETVTRQCPSGCFCLNEGLLRLANDSLFNITYAFWQTQCQSPSHPLSPQSQSLCNTQGYIGININNGSGGEVYLVCDREQYGNYNGYFFDEFSEIYVNSDFGGGYGRKNDEVVYFGGMSTSATGNLGMYGCPNSYPLSDAGAKTVYECYKYDASGNKVYYGTNTNITCAEGTYLPANATQCVSCNASQNHVCPGGRFEKSDVIQGLKLNCPKGKYLPANATQCSACDESHYFCFGGIYDFSATMDQGLVTHNGYVNMGNHTFITCNPGHYVPANTNQCSACSGDYACPGGLFFTDSSYDVDRGNILCWYGTPNSTHTACMPKFAKPSLAKSSMQATSVSTQLTTNKNIDKDEIVTSVIADESYESDKTTPSSAPKDINKNKISIFSLDEEGKEDTKNTKSDKKETKIDFGKVSISSDRAVTRRQESTSVSENNAISTKPIVHRSAKAIPQTSNSVQTDTTRERPDHIKRPSRGR